MGFCQGINEVVLKWVEELLRWSKGWRTYRPKCVGWLY